MTRPSPIVVTAPRLRYAWLIVVCLITFFVNSDALPTDIMESRNLVTANEMVEYDNWLLPTMNGTLRLEKPPLPTWVAGAIASAAPDNLIAQRAAAGVMGALWTLFFFLTVRTLSRRDETAVTCSLIFLTCYNVMLMGRTATWDIYCHAFMMGAIWLILRLFYPSRPVAAGRRLAEAAACGVLLGLSFLSKGPVSFFALLLPFLIATPLLGRPQWKGNGWGIAVMVAVCLILSCWWYIYIIVSHPEMATAIIHKETGAWVNHNVRPWYYYWRYFLETGAWAILTLAALLAPIFSRSMRRDKQFLFAVVWMLATVVLLSFMPEKKMRYLLPVMAPCAMSVGLLLESIARNWKEAKWGRILFRVNAWIVAVVAAGGSGGCLYLWLGMHKIGGVLAVVSAIVLLIIAVLTALCALRGRVVAFVDCVAGLFIAVEILLMSQVANFFVNPEYNSIKSVRNEARVKDIPFYCNDKKPLRMELVLAAGRRILPIDLSNSDSIARRLPCVVVTHGPVSQELPARILAQTDTLFIGQYDDNRHPATDRHYTADLLNRVTLLTPKTKEP